MASPFVDTVGENALVIPQGGIDYMRIALQTKAGGTLVPPDVDAFQRNDIVVIRDPDGADKTSAWAIDSLDPNDASDVYQDGHVTYVGHQARKVVTDGATTSASPVITSATANFNQNDVGKKVVGTGIPANTTILSVESATQATLTANATATGSNVSLTIGVENVGLFADGLGHVALKVKVPTNAEKTTNSSTRHWKVEWKVKKNGAYITKSETFDVGDAAVIVFSADVVTVSQVRALFTTPASDTQILGAIAEAAINVEGMLLQVLEAMPSPTPNTVLNGVVYETRRLLIDWEISTGRTANSVSQGGMSLSFDSAQNRIERQEKNRDAALMAYLRSQGIHAWQAPTAVVFHRMPQYALDSSKVRNMALNFFWRDV